LTKSFGTMALREMTWWMKKGGVSRSRKGMSTHSTTRLQGERKTAYKRRKGKATVCSGEKTLNSMKNRMSLREAGEQVCRPYDQIETEEKERRE